MLEYVSMQPDLRLAINAACCLRCCHLSSGLAGAAPCTPWQAPPPAHQHILLPPTCAAEVEAVLAKTSPLPGVAIRPQASNKPDWRCRHVGSVDVCASLARLGGPQRALLCGWTVLTQLPLSLSLWQAGHRQLDAVMCGCAVLTQLPLCLSSHAGHRQLNALPSKRAGPLREREPACPACSKWAAEWPHINVCNWSLSSAGALRECEPRCTLDL